MTTTRLADKLKQVNNKTELKSEAISKQLNSVSMLTRNISQTLISNTIGLGLDFIATSKLYGMALKAEANVKPPKMSDFAKLSEWRSSYRLTWDVLKFGFYPTFLFETAASAVASETAKRLNKPELAKYTDFVMPAIVGAFTAPAVSIAAINARYNQNMNMYDMIRKQGTKVIFSKTGGFWAIGIREGLFYDATHSNREKQSKFIANKFAAYKTVGFLFKNSDNKPTLLSHCIASSPDALALLAGQPLTMFAVNSAITKHKLQQQPDSLLNQKPSLNKPLALLKWQIAFNKLVCEEIIAQGKNHGLSSVWSFSPGMIPRTLSLFGTLIIFKTTMEPVKEFVAKNITHRGMS